MSATVILSILLILLVMGMLIIGFDTAMLVRNPPPQRDIVDPDSGASYVLAQQKKHPNRKLVYYGIGIFLQYVSFSISSSYCRSCYFQILFLALWEFSMPLPVSLHP